MDNYISSIKDLFQKNANALCIEYKSIRSVRIAEAESSETAIKKCFVKLHNCDGVKMNFDPITVLKNKYGLPSVELSDEIKAYADKAGVKDILVSSTNDMGTYFAIAAVLYNSENENSTPLGIGIDYMRCVTAEEMISESSDTELHWMFTEKELKEVYSQQDKKRITKTLLVMISAKEAIFKAVSEAYFHNSSNQFELAIDMLDFTDIQVTDILSKDIKIDYLNGMEQVVQRSGIEKIHINTIMKEEYVGAVALATGLK